MVPGADVEKFYSTLGKHRAVAVFSSPPGAFIGRPVFLLYCSLEWKRASEI